MANAQKFLKNISVLFLLILCHSSAVFAETTRSSMAALVASGQSMACTYEKNDKDGVQKGTIYLGQKKMRGDFDVTNNEGSFPMHMISDGEWMHTWGGPMGESQGMKMKVPPPGSAGPGRRQRPDMNEEMSMDCNPWPVDASKFELPSSVEFTDLGAMMGGMGAGGMDMKAMQCAACDQAPPEEQAQCRQVLGCS